MRRFVSLGICLAASACDLSVKIADLGSTQLAVLIDDGEGDTLTATLRIDDGNCSGPVGTTAFFAGEDMADVDSTPVVSSECGTEYFVSLAPADVPTDDTVLFEVKDDSASVTIEVASPFADRAATREDTPVAAGEDIVFAWTPPTDTLSFNTFESPDPIVPGCPDGNPPCTDWPAAIDGAEVTVTPPADTPPGSYSLQSLVDARPGIVSCTADACVTQSLFPIPDPVVEIE